MKDQQTIVIRIPGALKKRLDALQQQGFTIAGFTRAALEQALAQRGKGKRAA